MRFVVHHFWLTEKRRRATVPDVSAVAVVIVEPFLLDGLLLIPQPSAFGMILTLSKEQQQVSALKAPLP
jgi:hypothetical protein